MSPASPSATSDSGDPYDFLAPAVKAALDSAGLVYRTMACDPDLADTAAFCAAYGFTAGQSANTILVAGKPRAQADGTRGPVSFAACVVRADSRLDVNKAVCRQMDVKRASFASAGQTIELTGMQPGGVTAFGLPPDLPVYVDKAVLDQPEVVMGGGNRSSKVILDPAELKKLPGITVVEGLAKQKEA